MFKLRLLEIGNNVEGDIDGIGKHTRIVSKALRKQPEVEYVELIGGKTAGKGKLGKILSPVMIRALLLSTKKISQKNINGVIIEYPFMEYNPLIVFAVFYLKSYCTKYGCILMMSIHEYERVKMLRKMVIRILAKCSSLIFVSDENSKISLCRFNKNIYKRSIPNHIPLRNVNGIQKNRKLFVYFGLISKAKAFQEMVDAWNEFNSDGEMELLVITASDIKPNPKWKGIKIHKGLNDVEAADKMSAASYCILPVIPEVGLNNSSFISGLQCKCIPIGHFNEKLQCLDFIINVSDYSKKSLVLAFKRAIALDDSSIEIMMDKACSYGKKFTADETARQMVSAIIDYKGKINDYRN